MADLIFEIPLTIKDLLETTYTKYFVQNLEIPLEIKGKLLAAKEDFKHGGPEFILESFDIYYSVLYHADTLKLSIISLAYETLHSAMVSLNKNLGFLLENKADIGDDIKKKYVNIIKMLTYIYINIANNLLGKLESEDARNQPKKNRRSASSDVDNSMMDRKDPVHAVNNILQREISIFWGVQYVDEIFITMVADIGYQRMQASGFKTDKDLQNSVYHFFGTLIKNYSHGESFVVRIIHLVKSYEHVSCTVAHGIQLLITNYKCTHLLHELVVAICEFLADANTNENQATKSCSIILCDLAIKMPKLMMPEIFNLNKYLAHESHFLRNSILTIITEVLLAVFRDANLNEDEVEDRDMFLSILEDHMLDVSGSVRAKVFAQFAHLHEENVLPAEVQIRVIEACTRHLKDKVVAVRKSAINCLKAFMTYNVYGADLSLQQCVLSRDELKTELDGYLKRMEADNSKKLEELGGCWSSKVDKIKEVIEEHIDDPCDDLNISNLDSAKLSELVRLYVNDESYVDAFKMCKYATTHVDEYVAMRQKMDTESESDFLLNFMHYVFTDFTNILINMKQFFNESDMQRITELESAVAYSEHRIKYIEMINQTIPNVIDLLDSQFITDFQVSMELLVTAHRFNIDNATEALMSSLMFLERNEQERRDTIMDAFREIFLKSEAKNVQEHKEIIVKGLIDLLQKTSYPNFNNLCQLISAWSEKGILDNNIIDMLWRFFTENTDNSARGALELLKMASAKRISILSRNIKLISTVAFNDRKTDLLLVKCACDTLSVIGNQKQLITDENPPFRIKYEDEMWNALADILITNFLIPNKHFLGVISSTIHCIYSLCSSPEQLCDKILKTVYANIRNLLKSSGGTVTCFMLTRILYLFGEIAIRQFHYLDENVYNEMKRQNYITESNKNVKMNSKATFSTASDSMNSSQVATDEMSFMEGAQAEDTDADFIINVLENNVVNGSSSLKYITNAVIEVCTKPVVYDDKILQTVAVSTLGKYMIVSSIFCKQHLDLLFQILEQTPHTSVKLHIVVIYADLLERFPNVVETWISKMFERLHDESYQVRRCTFFVICHLALKDVIRVQRNISELAVFLVAKEEELRTMSKDFFGALAAKGHVLCNVLPDIFSHIGDNTKVTQEEFTNIMTYLFKLLDKTKYMESLIDRFCLKFNLSDSDVVHKNVAFCLTLIQYNEKCLKKLLDQFQFYKDCLHNKDVYASFKTILSSASTDAKPEVKTIVSQIEEKMKGFFEVNDVNPPTHKSNKKSAAPNRKQRGKNRRRISEDDSDDDREVDSSTSENQSDPSRSGRRTRRSTAIYSGKQTTD